MTETPCGFKEPESINDILELLVKLKDTDDVQTQVCKRISEEVTPFCQDVTGFYNGSSGSSGSSQYLYGVMSGVDFLRTSILSRPDDDKYSHIQGSHFVCVDKIAESLKRAFPRLCAAFLFFYFNASDELSQMHGGKWSSQQYNGSRGGSDLNKWLVEPPPRSNSGLVPGGFSSGNLTASTASSIVSTLKFVVSHGSPGNLQSALCYMLFICDWDPALTGHALLFLHMFCEKIREGNGLERIYGGDFEKLKKVFIPLGENLSPLVRSIDLGSTVLRAVCQQNSGLFNSVFNSGLFENYLGWLKGRLQDLIASLDQMFQDSASWDQENIKNVTSGGPFKYGFVFHKDVSDWETQKSNLSTQIQTLKSSLESLQDFFKDPSSLPSSGSAGSAAAGASVGVLGLGGAGAGAAYAGNFFGFKDIMSGIVGTIRGLVTGL